MVIVLLDSRNDLCEICETELASHKCRSCGRMVCFRDFDYEKKVCLVCKETLCSFCGLKPSIKYCSLCGRTGCEDCLIQESLVSYVCRECFKRKFRDNKEGGGIENR